MSLLNLETTEFPAGQISEMAMRYESQDLELLKYGTTLNLSFWILSMVDDFGVKMMHNKERNLRKGGLNMAM